MKPLFVDKKPVMQTWTGLEIRLLRQAKRMSIREFAKCTGVSDRMISKWEAGGADIEPRPLNQARLDTTLEQLNAVELTRFCTAVAHAAMSENVVPPQPTAEAASASRRAQRTRTRQAPMPAPLPRREDFAARYGGEGLPIYDGRDPFWHEPRMSTVLERRDIAGLYHLLQRRGVSQRHIANLVGQTQSEVSGILAGRQVHSYDVLERIVQGLRIPRGRMGMAYRPEAPPSGVTRRAAR